MKKKAFAAIALMSCFALGASLTGCSLVSTNNRLDMEQVIATVDISDELGSNFADYKAAVSSKKIIKRELVSYFLNVGYSYVQNGSSYEETFNSLVDALVNNAVLVQYSTVEILSTKTQAEKDAFIKETDEVKKYESLLDNDEVNLAKYKLYSSINSAIDNYEKSVIEEEEGYKGTETRTTPTNLNAEQDDYYPAKDDKLNYGIYTGYGDYTLENSGAYYNDGDGDALDGTTRSTRVKAYNIFLNNLRRNNLVDGDKEADKLTDIIELKYIKTEYVSQLESQIINKYYDLYEEEREQTLLTDGYIEKVYNDVKDSQKENYGNSTSAFDTAMSSMSSSSFVLYSPDTSDSDWVEGDDSSMAKYGFIYNILLPFSARQSVQLNALKSIQSADGDDNYYFAQRNQLLRQIETVDQRSAWFNGETDYSFKPDESFGDYYGKADGREYLFFEDSLTDSGEDGRYKKLQAYEGKYAYNGKVIQNKDESYTLKPNKLDIDDMLAEFSNYVNYVIDGNINSNRVEFNNNYVPANGNEDYYKDNNKDKYFIKAGTDDEIDYSKLIYAEGKVKFGGDFNNADLMNPESVQYQAMSAVNELQFAYTTDTSVLSNYIGYSLSAYDTSYIKEFEYAAKKAVSNGPGSFAVCAGDYGWHLIYVTFVFDNSGTETYSPTWDKEHIEKEGTFENLFFEWVKSNDLTDISTTRRTKILNEFNKDTTVTKYQNRYQDLLDLDK